MQLGRVTGTVVATIKSEGLEGFKFLVVQPLNKQQHQDLLLEVLKKYPDFAELIKDKTTG